jgi:hypothetical protein
MNDDDFYGLVYHVMETVPAAQQMRPCDIFLAYEFKNMRARQAHIARMYKDLRSFFNEPGNFGLDETSKEVQALRPNVTPVALEEEPILVVLANAEVMVDLLQKTLGTPLFLMERRNFTYLH